MQLAIVAAICVAGIPLCTSAARRLGGRKDPGSIVFDEIASVPITFFLIPLNTPWIVVAGFLLHRLFDITKPPPARALERLPEGLGIMADDWIAGLYSNLALHGLIWSNPGGIFSG
jgi:phosphatidylglycerophosphatase A